MQVYVQYVYIAMSVDSYVPFTEPQIELCTHIWVVYYCEKAHFLRHKTEHTYASEIYYQIDFIKMSCTVKLSRQ